MTGTMIRNSGGATVAARQSAGDRDPVLHRAWAAAAAGVAKLAAGVSRAAINARILRQLGAMSERELKDIGLVRQDLHDAAALRQDGDSTTLLLARREERKAARRA
ncbi:hypothetical protein ASG60_04195 [Methylobacterium sp. Leaf469]|uniref:DUF1127 domain-containing protein n=1 Tax=unclassified Methylobacterium TaxID=2615210 RepID=UPI0006F51040|nr:MULTISPECIES: DUF1127 domain-containing protein [unclassified Methylobacterium]KQO72798.1 hypothetical protein ASF22_00120 [Methylobacterium sp. Leaf87]KQT98918.1 hypothetical protein ASG60_04195 [Methylobacterium sp. Leaf469]